MPELVPVTSANMGSAPLIPYHYGRDERDASRPTKDPRGRRAGANRSQIARISPEETRHVGGEHAKHPALRRASGHGHGEIGAQHATRLWRNRGEKPDAETRPRDRRLSERHVARPRLAHIGEESRSPLDELRLVGDAPFLETKHGAATAGNRRPVVAPDATHRVAK